MTVKQQADKKILENSLVGSLMVPIAIVLVGALIIFGVTKMLSTDRSYKDLVAEINTKTFGNKWIAAYELSKLISSSRIPEGDIPWLVENLGEIYKDAQDPRTRNFVIVAMGALKSKDVVPYLEQSLKDKDLNVRFHGLVAVGDLPKNTSFNFGNLEPFLSSEIEFGQLQAAILVAGTHKLENYKSKIISFLDHNEIGVRYAAASALTNFKEEKAVNRIKEILLLEYADKGKFTIKQIAALKYNVLTGLAQSKWSQFSDFLVTIKEKEKDIKIVAKITDVLNVLKN